MRAEDELRKNTMDIAAWLQELGLERYVQAFRDNEINERVLLKLTADDVRELGISAIGHRRLLLEAIAGLTAGAKPAASDVGCGSILPSRLKPSGAS